VPTSATAAAAETEFTYLDVGVNVEMTPTIHANRDVTLKLSVGVSSQSGTDTISGVAEPVISQETAEEVIRVKDGESSIVAGLVKRQENRNVSGWPGFGEIPLLKYLFTTQSHEVINDELVFLIVPHVVRAPIAETSLTPPIDTGTERAIELRGVPQM
jgi:general secretion pathway protein D